MFLALSDLSGQSSHHKAYFYRLSVSWSSCRFRIWNPGCVAANVICSGVRVVAFKTLALAQVGLGVPIAVLETAKKGVTVAQVALTAPQLLLEAAKTALSIAQSYLESMKYQLEGAKNALELVKKVVKFGLYLLDSLVRFALEKIFYIKRMTFEIEVTTRQP